MSEKRGAGLLTVKEAAELCKVKPQTVYRAITDGRLPAYRVGGGYGPLRVSPRALLESYLKPAQRVARLPNEDEQ